MDEILTIQVVCSPIVASSLRQGLAQSKKVTIVPDAMYPGYEVPIHKTGRDHWEQRQPYQGIQRAPQKESHHE